MQENINIYEEDEIDLRELWNTLMKRKMMVITTTILLTLGAAVYVTLAKPIYSGSAMMEIGEVVNNSKIVMKSNTISKNNEPITIFYLDNVYNLKDIISQATGVNVKIPKKTTNILKLSYTNRDKEAIKTKLTFAVDYIVNRHKEKAKLYEGKNAKIRLSKLVGEITMIDKAIKPKKALIIIVAFITGLIFSIFLVFFMEFIQGTKKEENLK